MNRVFCLILGSIFFFLFEFRIKMLPLICMNTGDLCESQEASASAPSICIARA